MRMHDSTTTWIVKHADSCQLRPWIEKHGSHHLLCEEDEEDSIALSKGAVAVLRHRSISKGNLAHVVIDDGWRYFVLFRGEVGSAFQ